MHEILKKSYIFFGGKGGVGKTTCAAAASLIFAEHKRRTLIVSTDPAHSTSDIFDKPIKSKDTVIAENLWGLEIDPHDEARRYMEGVKKSLKEVVSAALVEEIKRQINIAYVTPGAEEAAIFDKFVELMGRVDTDFDCIVFDTAPTGHTLRLLSLPELLGVWMDSMVAKRKKALKLKKMLARVQDEHDLVAKIEAEDPILGILEARRQRFTYARDLLLDKEKTSFVFVITPEKLPILETRRAVTMLERHGIHVGGIVVNRVLPEGLEGEFFAKRKAQEAVYLEEIRSTFGKKVLATVPLLEEDVRGMESLKRLIPYLQEAAA